VGALSQESNSDSGERSGFHRMIILALLQSLAEVRCKSLCFRNPPLNPLQGGDFEHELGCGCGFGRSDYPHPEDDLHYSPPGRGQGRVNCLRNQIRAPAGDPVFIE
jgi:hypothetical protein